MKRVLVVEDDKNNMRLLVKLLKNHGYDTIKAEKRVKKELILQ